MVMGLDINFYSVKKKSIGYFRKVNFLLTYFNITEEQNAQDIPISKEELCNFAADLKCELVQHKFPCEDSPINPAFQCTSVYFGGSVGYNESYWEDLKQTYEWATKTLKEFDWDNDELVINAWW